jgi:hypothetical protein
VLHDDRHEGVAPLDAVALLALQQPVGAAEPAGRRPDLPLEGEVDAEPDRASGRPRGVLAVEVRLMGALERPQGLVVEADHVRRGRQQLQIIGAERSRLVSLAQRGVRVGPVSRLICPAPPLQSTGRMHGGWHRGRLSVSCPTI